MKAKKTTKPTNTIDDIRMSKTEFENRMRGALQTRVDVTAPRKRKRAGTRKLVKR